MFTKAALRIGLLVVFGGGMAGQSVAGTATTEFGCGQNSETRANFDPKPKLAFVAVPDISSIKVWRTRPKLTFGGFDAKRYGFSQVEFYRWRTAIPGREDTPPDTQGYPTNRLALAVRLLGSEGERWFELKASDSDSEQLLYFQPAAKLPDNGDPDSGNGAAENRKASEAKSGDEMSEWVTLEPATPNAGMPIFQILYDDVERGMYQEDSFERQLLLDLRSAMPLLVKAVSCDRMEVFSGAGSAMAEASETRSQFQCEWDGAATDFRCTHTVPFGGSHAIRTGQRNFFLLSGRDLELPAGTNRAADWGQLALRVRENQKSSAAGVVLPGLGPTTLLQRFEGLLPDGDVFAFASPGPGSEFNARLWLVTVTSDGKSTAQAIPTWSIGGEAREEEPAPEGYMPLTSTDTYQSKILEERPGFRGFEAILKARPENTPVHVVYWIGIEATAAGKLVANAVRLASDGYASGEFGQEYLASTASAITRKVGAAEATVRVQGQFNPDYENPYPTEEANCVWDGALHWKAGSGFRVRRLREDCQAAHLEVKITDEGALKTGSAH